VPMAPAAQREGRPPVSFCVQDIAEGSALARARVKHRNRRRLERFPRSSAPMKIQNDIVVRARADARRMRAPSGG
jgi:RNase P protein component